MQKQNIKVKGKIKIQAELKQLRKELAKVKLEKAILEKCAECLQARTQVKFEFIDQHLSYFPVKDMCRVLDVSTIGYYKWRSKTLSKRDQYNLVLLEQIKKIHYRNKKRYGSPRIAKELKALGFHASEKLIRKLMKSASLESVFKRKFRITTNSSHKYPIVENKLQRSFQAHRENEVWVSDITYVWAGKRWLYFTVIIDLYDRKVVGWSLSTTLKTRYTTVEAFKKAITNRPIRENSSLIFHSDRGIQYACKEFVEELRPYKSVSRSMSRKGDCWDNAVSESFFKTIKTELVYQNSYQNKHQAEISIAYYIENFYNVKRRHSFLDNRNIFENNQLLKHT
ncbi:IS3 family transposase [Flavobacterium rakeshii]|uniref:IS3 family transposase n=1 Tax=Flavobacterium rakeshii TaxID=1038845 RepID=A0A6N8HG00_9FLAO|nr:IS3 family transposase [Flavobacterium rakeshii]MUV04667.1 IS3 family transposase [Flavobacterium rakeshii]